MITASCFFCEDVRREVNGQESWIGVFDSVLTEVNTSHGRLFAKIAIHMPLDEASKRFGIKIFIDDCEDEFTAPSEEYIDDGVASAKKLGFPFAVFPATVDLGGRVAASQDGVSIRIFLSVDGKDQLIGSFAVTPGKD